MGLVFDAERNKHLASPTTHSVMNGAVLLLLAIRAPNFRPRFRYFNKWTAALGIVLPLTAMFGIDIYLSLIFIGERGEGGGRKEQKDNKQNDNL